MKIELPQSVAEQLRGPLADCLNNGEMSPSVLAGQVRRGYWDEGGPEKIFLFLARSGRRQRAKLKRYFRKRKRTTMQTDTQTLELTGLQIALIDKTNATYREFVELGENAADSILAFTNRGREVGIDLQTLKANTFHRQFEQLALDMSEDEPRLEFNLHQVKAFLRLVERLPKPAADMTEAVSSLKDVLMLQGTLPFPEGHGEQRVHDRDPFALVTRYVMEIQAIWTKEIKGLLPHMSPDRKQSFRDQIKPIVRIYELLAA